MYFSRVLPVVTKQASKISGWLVLKNGWADLFQLWIVDSTQLELARSVIK